MATTNDLKNGMTLNIDGQLWTVVDFQHVKPGKGGAFVRTKLKNVLSGKVVDRTFNAGVKVETASVDKREMQYLYREGEDFVFMDTQDYDQPRIPAATVGDAADLVRGVHAHQERIDELLAENSQGWALDRMPAVDRNLLRIGAYELLWAEDIPDAVAISEAVQLARDLSTEGSPAFVNGLLARLLELKPTLTL